MYGITYIMATHILSASELRRRLAEVLALVKKEGAPCFVTKSGRAVAALLPIELYDQILSALEDRMDEEDPSLAAEVREARREYKAGKSLPLTSLKRLLRS